MNELEQHEAIFEGGHFDLSNVLRHRLVGDWQVAEAPPPNYIIVEGGAFWESPGSTVTLNPETKGRYIPQSQEDLDELKRQVASLQGHILSCLEQISTLSDLVDDSVISRTSSINSIIIDDNDVILTRPLFFLIEEYADDDEIVARIPELQADGFGPTEIQAINELKTLLGDLYQDLMDSSDDSLGKLPMQWKHILQEIVGTNA